MKITLILPLASTVLLLSCQEIKNPFSSESSYSQPTYEQTKLTLEQQEQRNPTQFLRCNGTYRQNLINEWVLEGNIQSSATVARYKDPVLTIVYRSETGTVVGREDYPIYKFIGPGQTLPFKIKRNGFSGTASIGYEVTNATAIN